MRIWILIIFVIGYISCQEPEPTLYQGTSNVFATDGEISDTLNNVTLSSIASFESVGK